MEKRLLIELRVILVKIVRLALRHQQLARQALMELQEVRCVRMWLAGSIRSVMGMRSTVQCGSSVLQARLPGSRYVQMGRLLPLEL